MSNHIATWVFDAFETWKRFTSRAVGVTSVSLPAIQSIVGCNTYQAKKIRGLMLEFGMVFKSDNGRYYLSISPFKTEWIESALKSHRQYVNDSIPF